MIGSLADLVPFWVLVLGSLPLLGTFDLNVPGFRFLSLLECGVRRRRSRLIGLFVWIEYFRGVARKL